MAVTDSELFSFNGVDVANFLAGHGYLFKVNSTSGRELIQQEHNVSHVSGRDGGRLLDTTLPSRTITVEYTIKSDSYIDMRQLDDLLGGIFLSEGTKRLSFRDQVGHYNATYESKEVSLENHLIQQGTLTFFCPEPFRFGSKVYLPEFAMTPTKSAMVEANTNYQIEPILTFRTTGTATFFSVAFEGGSIRIEVPVKNGTIIEVNTQTAEVRVDNQIKVLEVTGSFPVLTSKPHYFIANIGATFTGEYTEIFV